MLYAAGFASLSLASPLLKIRSERKHGGREPHQNKNRRSDVTVGAETSVASDTMLAILKMAEAVPAEIEVTPPPTADESQVWWLNHPLMCREFSLDDTVDACYAELKRIIAIDGDRISPPKDWDLLRSAIDDHNIRFPLVAGTREVFNIIEIFFEDKTILPQAVG